MEKNLIWPLGARATITALPAGWSLKCYGSGPDHRYNGDLVTLGPSRVQELASSLPRALSRFEALLAALPEGVTHEETINGIRVKVAGPFAGAGLCIAPAARWSGQFTASAKDVPALISALQEAQNTGEELLAVLRALPD